MNFKWWDHLGGHLEGGMTGEQFPTPDHPPRNILMGGEAQVNPGMICDGHFPQLQHLGPADQSPRQSDHMTI